MLRKKYLVAASCVDGSRRERYRIKYVGMLTSSSPTNRNTISFAAATSIEPAFIMSSAPEELARPLVARLSMGQPSTIPAGKSSTSRA